ncbi:hypothetical protein DPEC_G00039080 [Dallia pectoralis]|uniref:Uncharacterized protein n=1 Tax=Dallia pectoralis TaxID=75939 RepID=A0ACC2HEI1_DALPE|nr:hypothetical protein DPEC_G00039080 [Dallia pectoralis]
MSPTSLCPTAEPYVTKDAAPGSEHSQLNCLNAEEDVEQVLTACRTQEKINAEFKRITTVPLQSKFLSQLDLYSDNLVKLFKKKGGQQGERLKNG